MKLPIIRINYFTHMITQTFQQTAQMFFPIFKTDLHFLNYFFFCVFAEFAARFDHFVDMLLLQNQNKHIVIVQFYNCLKTKRFVLSFVKFCFFNKNNLVWWHCHCVTCQLKSASPCQLKKLSTLFTVGAFHTTQPHPHARKRQHGRSLTVMPWTYLMFTNMKI